MALDGVAGAVVQVPSRDDDRPGGEEGGDAACWLARVCPECGLFVEGELPAVCGRCGAVVAAEDGDGS